MKQVKVFDELFAEKLKRLRKSRGMTLQQLSAATGISPSYISRLERNEKQCPSFPILVELGRALKVNVMTLAEGLADQEEVVDLHSLMFKSSLRVADKTLSEEETRHVIAIIERIIDFQWTDESVWNEIAELGSHISKLKNID